MIRTQAGRDGLDWLIARPIAHRGFHDKAAGIEENTASAFSAAIAGGYAIECDLQLSADGEAMVFHDPTLGRLTTENGPVIAKSAAELSAVTFRISSDRMQRLGDLFDQVAGRVPLVLEMKTHWDGDTRIAHRVCQLAREYHGDVAVMSFDPHLVATAKSLAPDLPHGLVADLFLPEDWLELDEPRRSVLRSYDTIRQTDPDFMSFGLDALDGDNAARFRKTGRPIICWTVRSPDAARAALEFCDQITFEGFRA